MQWLSVILSFFLGKFNVPHRPSLKETAAAIIEEATYKSRKPAALLLGGIVSVLLLCGGFFMGLLDLTQQFDRNGIIVFTATFGSALTLVVVSLGVFAWVFAYAWPGARKHAAEEHQKEQVQLSGSPLEQALATLLLDFVKEREEKRELKREQALHPLATTPLEKESPAAYN